MTRREALIILSFLVVLFASPNVLSGTTPIESLVPKIAPDGWALRDAPETFTRETLFEHIDGQADLFLQYGFEKSVFAIYRNVNSSDDKIDVDIYDMGNSLQAFGVFSRFRQEESPAGIGLDSYLDGSVCSFLQGQVFCGAPSHRFKCFNLETIGTGDRISDFGQFSPTERDRVFPKKRTQTRFDRILSRRASRSSIFEKRLQSILCREGRDKDRCKDHVGGPRFSSLLVHF